MKILLVDDDEGIRDIYSDILMEEGLEVETFADGFKALQRLARGQDFSVIVTDYKMPRMDGFALAHACAQLHPNRGMARIWEFSAIRPWTP